MNLHTDNYEYRLGEEYRRKLRDEADHRRLAGKIQSRRTGFVAVAVVILLAVLFASHMKVSAQNIPMADTDGDNGNLAIPVNYRIGNYYLVKEDYERAIFYFSQTVVEVPDFGYAYARLGDCHMALEDYKAAIADYTRAIAVFPDYASAFYARGLAYIALDGPEQAVPDFQSAIALVPDYPLPYLALGDAYYNQSDYAGALDEYHAYLRLAAEPVTSVVERVYELEAMPL